MTKSLNCKNCNKEFTEKHKSRGMAQRYCSINCRQKASYQRMKEKFIEEGAKEVKSFITNNVEIEQEIKTMKDLSDQLKRSGINRLIHWLMESNEKLTAETILNVAKCFSWEEKFFYDFMNTWKPANPIKKTK
jgi:hypothetical protein